MKRIIVEITDGIYTFSEDVTDNIPGYEEHQLREIEIDGTTVEEYNVPRTDPKSHFIFGWIESLSQSDNLMSWMVEPDVKIILRVIHKYTE